MVTTIKHKLTRRMVEPAKDFIAEPTKREILKDVLMKIKEENGGLLQAEKVVEAAEPENSPLHRYFQWDDTEAAHQWRLQQARTLINVSVVLLPGDQRPVTQFVSLRFDRQNPQGGYRELIEVLSDREMREILLREALDDLNTWEKKYNRLAELSPIFEAINTVNKKTRKKK